MKKRALIISVNSYSDSNHFPQIKQATQDAEGLAAILRNKNGGDFDTVEVLDNAKLENSDLAMANFYETANEDDLLLLYFCGHAAHSAQGKMYLAFADTPHQALETHGLAVEKLGNIMNSSRNKQQLVIFDCYFDADNDANNCNANKTTGANSDSPLTLIGCQLAPKHQQFEGNKQQGRIVFSTSDKKNTINSPANTQNKQVFSLYMQALISGFSKAEAQNYEGNITANSLHQYVYREVHRQSQGKQSPQILVFSNNKDLTLVKNKQLELPAEITTLLQHEQANLRLAGITQLKFLCRNQSHIIPAAKRTLQQLSRNRNVFVQGEATEVLQSLLTAEKEPSPHTANSQPALDKHSRRTVWSNIPLELHLPSNSGHSSKRKLKSWLSTASILAIAVTLNWWLMSKQKDREYYQINQLPSQVEASILASEPNQKHSASQH